MLCPDEKIDLRFRLVAQLSHLGSEEGRRQKIRKKVRGRAARAVRRQKDQLIQELDQMTIHVSTVYSYIIKENLVFGVIHK